MRGLRPHRLRRSSHGRALAPEPAEHLRFIRDTMSRSAAFTAVSGLGQVVLGASALAAAWMAGRQPVSSGWLRVWLGEAVVATAISLISMRAKAERLGLPLLSGPGRKVAIGLGPAFAAGAVLTYLLHGAGADAVLPPAWMLLYGAGVITGGAYSISLVPLMGMCFMVMGTLAAVSPPAWSEFYLAGSFGAVHILFGILIARRHGG